MPRPVEHSTQTGGVIYRISKTFPFSASHQLEHLPEGHKCKRLHGHNYIVTLVFKRDELDEWSFVRDFDSLNVFQNWVDVRLDHRHLNDVLRDPREDHPKEAIQKAANSLQPTSENLAWWIFNRWSQVWPDLEAVKVSEGLDTWAEYSA